MTIPGGPDIPANTQAERQLLGGLLLDQCDPANAAAVWAILSPEDFWVADHQRVARAVRRLYDGGTLGDQIAVHDELVRSGEAARVDFAEAVGGDRAWGLIGDLMQSAPHSANVVHHARIVLEHSRRRLALEAADRIVAAVRSQKTADEALAEAEAAIREAMARGQDRSVSLADALLAAMENISAREGGEVLGVPTGLAELDAALGGGLGKGWMVVVGARPGQGKSCLGMHFAEHAARLGVPALVFSLEMGHDELAERMLSGNARVGGSKLKAGVLTEAERHALGQAYERLKGLPVRIDDDPARTMMQVAALARRHQAQRGLGLVVVDYLQLVDGTGEADGRRSRQEVMAQISRRLKVLARELEVPVVALSQLNRECEGRADKRPLLSDLRESGAIEQDADVVMLMHRPEYWNPGESPGLAECIIAKSRHGKTGTVNLRFSGSLSLFEDWHEPVAIGANGEQEEPF